MMRSTFANVRIRNLMLPPDQDGRPVEGGLTLASRQRPQNNLRRGDGLRGRQHPYTVIFAGDEYGTISSRELGRQGARLLARREGRGGERASSASTAPTLVGMGVLPYGCRQQQRHQPRHPRRRCSTCVRDLEGRHRPARSVT